MRTTSRHLLRILTALVAAAGIFLLAGCELGTIATPGGTLSVSVDSSYDVSSLQAVVVFDTDRFIGNGNEAAFAFPLSEYADDFGGIYHTMSFSCPEVPEGDYFVYAWLDFDADEEYDPFDDETGWLYDESRFNSYHIDAFVTPHEIVYGRGYTGDPAANYFVTDRFAAPMEIALEAVPPS
jgi:hypothetical protein